MAIDDVAAALQRVRSVLERRPESGIHDDSAATASWAGGTRVFASHPGGARYATDMPAEFGGSGEHVTPGWFFRAGLASCTATSIAFVAAGEGVQLDLMEVKVASRSDSRGLLGLADAGGSPVEPGPVSIGMQVRIAAAGVPAAELQRIAREGFGRSPVPGALKGARPIEFSVEVVTAPASPPTAGSSDPPQAMPAP
ncbi:Osmotically inducible protein OsmC [Burkholderiales bacterium 8X]|nr:Osmotically inducible protein OsmC [Burkholderiales bacterium 8X]